MELEQAIKHAIDGQAILFAGSGFSYGAKNAKGTVPMTGQSLAKFLAEECGIKRDVPLDIIADIYAKEFSNGKLIELLKQEYTIIDIPNSQKIIMSLPWRRVYTTNYDHTAELAAQSNDIILNTISADESITDSNNICIHINGSIEHLTEDTIKTSFKLTDRSYSSRTLDGNPGYELLKNDLQNVQAIIIIGYSALSDLDIKRLLAAVKHKTVFINRPNPDKIDELVNNYGSLYSIGINSFSEKVSSVKQEYYPSVAHCFSCFENYIPSSLSDSSVTYDDIVKMFVYGMLQDACFTKAHDGNYQYLVTRSKLSRLLNFNQWRKVTIVHSNLGNGKSFFLQLAKRELFQAGMSVFVFQHYTDTVEKEIKWICDQVKPCVVIIDNFEQWRNILLRFGYELNKGNNNIHFILTSRSKVLIKFKTLIPQLLQVKESEINTFCIDELDTYEIEQLSLILSKHGLLNEMTHSKKMNEYIKNNCHSHLSEVLLNVFQSSDIYQRLSILLSENSSISQSVKNAGIFILLMDYMNITLSPADLFDLFDVDSCQLSKTEYTWIDELIDIETNSYRVHSSVISKAFLENTINVSDIVDTLIVAVRSADRIYQENCDGINFGISKDMLINLLSHSHYLYWTQKVECQNEIIRFYDSIRQTKFCNSNSLFWSQFASAYIDCKQWEPAHRCIQNSFALAAQKKLIPYQTETVFARLIIEKLLFDIASNQADGNRIIHDLQECKDRLNKYINEPKNNRYYRIRGYMQISPIWEIGKTYLDENNLTQLIGLCNTMRREMDSERQNNGFNDEIEKCIRIIYTVAEQAKEKIKTRSKYRNDTHECSILFYGVHSWVLLSMLNS